VDQRGYFFKPSHEADYPRERKLESFCKIFHSHDRDIIVGMGKPIECGYYRLDNKSPLMEMQISKRKSYRNQCKPIRQLQTPRITNFSQLELAWESQKYHQFSAARKPEKNGLVQN